MNNKIIAVLLVLVMAVAGFLLVQNAKLKNKINELNQQPTETLTTPQTNDLTGKPANPEGASPFDKPNVDPMADSFVTTTGKQALTTISFDRTVHDFGRINEGDIVNTTFKIKNTGPVALFVYNAQASCGCTVPHWTQTPIKKGDVTDITVQFDSEGKHGEVSKTVTILTNTEPATTALTIKATIIPKDK